MRAWRYLVLAFVSSCEGCKEHAVCCVESDGSVSAGTVLGDPICPNGSDPLASREVDKDNEKALGRKTEDVICGEVCCIVGEQRSLTSVPTCVERNGQTFQAEACDGAPPDEDPPTGSTCACRDAGVVFRVVSGCEGPAFSDATTSSYCSSHVSENLSADPATHPFNDGDVLGFPACQVEIDCP